MLYNNTRAISLKEMCLSTTYYHTYMSLPLSNTTVTVTTYMYFLCLTPSISCQCRANAWTHNPLSPMNDVIKTEFLIHSNKGIHKSACCTQNSVPDEPTYGFRTAYKPSDKNEYISSYVCVHVHV
jgi:hypothetical protein